jgi:hypothetical protein
MDELGVVIMDPDGFRTKTGHDVQKEHYFGKQSQRKGTVQTGTNLSQDQPVPSQKNGVQVRRQGRSELIQLTRPWLEPISF